MISGYSHLDIVACVSVYWDSDTVMQNRELQIMRKLDHDNIVRLRYFFYSSGDKVINASQTFDYIIDLFQRANCYHIQEN